MSDSAADGAPRLREVADHMHVRVFMADALRIEAGRWNARDVRSPYWRFYRNEDDGAFIDLAGVDGSRFGFAAGQVCFVPAGVRFSCGNADPFRHFYVHFDVIGLPSLTMRALFDGPVALRRDDAFEARVAELAREVGRAPALGLAAQCRIKALVYEGLARSLEEAPAERRERGLRRAEALEPVVPALRHVEANPAARLSTAELAALCCLSPDHFARRFKECVGQTPAGYVRERRVTLAAQRLLFTDDSLDAIAESCGFGNRNYFTRVFTRATGTPPAAYRKSRRV